MVPNGFPGAADGTMREISAEQFVAAVVAGGPVVDAWVHGVVSANGILVAPRVEVRRVRFADAVFMQDARFEAPVTFEGCRFEGGAHFRSARFARKADFSGTVFSAAAYFWRARFMDDVLFKNIVVEAKGKAMGNVDPGEFNLSWARFNKQANFYRARLHSPFRLWRTVFLDDVNMEEMLFDGPAILMGRAQDISIDLQEIAQDDSYNLFTTLDDARLVTGDDEVIIGSGPRPYPRFVHPLVSSETDMREVLMRTSLPPALRERVFAAFREPVRGMFAPDKKASLKGIEISASGQLELMDMDMGTCELLGTPLANSKLSSVIWPTKSLVAGTVIRYTSVDERDSVQELPRLQQLYSDLAIAYEKLKDDIPASRFRMSAREMARRNQRGATRFMSSCYCIFAAYGESPGLALLWLATFVLILFPLAFLAVARPAGLTFARAVLKSLEVVTFLGSEDRTPNELHALVTLRVLMGVERIIVSSQVGFFLLALRRLFPQ